LGGVALLFLMSGGRTPSANAAAGCDLTVTKNTVPADLEYVSEGGSIEYQMVVENIGTDSCDNVDVTDALGDNVYCTDATASGGTFTITDCSAFTEAEAGDDVTWTGGVIDDGTSVTLTVDVQLIDDAADGDDVDNTVSAVDDPDDVTGDSADYSLEVVNDCDLDIDKVADVDDVEPGDEITYTITVTNNADENGAGCTDISVEDDLEDTDLECVEASVNHHDGLTFDQDNIDDSCDDNDVIWAAEDGDVLPGGDYVELELTVATDEDLDNGDRVTNRACVFGRIAGDFTVAPPLMEICSTERTDIVEPTATPTTAPTATRTPAPVFTVAPPPTSGPQATVVPPVTGDGPDGSGTNWFAVGMAVGVLALVIGSSVVLARKRIRVR
jgi:fimbrial isopeptide formation D2 family protein/uncharacterized repeat protein (TIGR01451 family)